MADEGEFLELMPAEELRNGQMTDYEHPGGGHQLLVARVDDQFYITQGHCQHMGGPLAKGKLDGTIVTCPWHHSQYDLTTGQVKRWTDWTGGLATMNEAIRHPRSLVAYESKVEDGMVFVGPEKPLAPVPPGV